MSEPALQQNWSTAKSNDRGWKFGAVWGWSPEFC